MKLEKIEVKNLTKLHILFLLYSNSMHGYKLIKELEKILGKKPSASHVYPFLIKLKKLGYLKISKKGLRNKKIYILTPKGKEFVSNILSRMSSLLDSILYTKVKVCINCGCKIYEGGYLKKINNKILLFCCEHCSKNYKI